MGREMGTYPTFMYLTAEVQYSNSIICFFCFDADAKRVGDEGLHKSVREPTQKKKSRIGVFCRMLPVSHRFLTRQKNASG